MSEAAAKGFEALARRARREVDEGILPSCQLAIAREGEIVWFETLGTASPSTRYTLFSSTKAVFAGAVWMLIGDGILDVGQRVIEFLPEFGTNGKDLITVEQLMTQTAGIPHAPMDFVTAQTSVGRRERYARWRVNWPPGTSSEYHPTSAHWVLADIVERITGLDYRDFVRTRVLEPLGLRSMQLGVPLDEQADIADLTVVGAPADADELQAVLRVRSADRGEVTVHNMLQFNDPVVRAIGVPGGGAVSTAADVALYFQGLLRNPDGLWNEAVLGDATSRVRNNRVDRLMGWPASCSLGLQIAGADGKSGARGFGNTVSPAAFGWAGAGGQLAWADPATGVSFAHLTDGIDANPLRQGRRGVALGSLVGLACSDHDATWTKLPG